MSRLRNLDLVEDRNEHSDLTPSAEVGKVSAVTAYGGTRRCSVDRTRPVVGDKARSLERGRTIDDEWRKQVRSPGDHVRFR